MFDVIAFAKTTLPDLAVGDRCLVSLIAASSAGSKRLADMGFVRGAELTMIRPGSPCIVRIDGRCVGLGAAHQENIHLAGVAR